MTQTGTGRADVTADLLAIQSSTLEAVQHYRRCQGNSADNPALRCPAADFSSYSAQLAVTCSSTARNAGPTTAS
jgi:hypothetical protein